MLNTSFISTGSYCSETVSFISGGASWVGEASSGRVEESGNSSVNIEQRRDVSCALL